MKKIKFFSFAFLLFGIGIGIAQGQVGKLNEDARQKLNNVDKQFFIENKGQWPSEVLYLTQIGGLNTWITTKGMLYEFYKTEELKDESATSDVMQDKFEHATYKRWGHRVAYKLLGNNTVVNTEGEKKQAGYNNYLIGNDPSKYASNVSLYKEALIKDVYTGIDMRYYFDKGLLRYDYIVHPEADPSQIRFSLEGSDKTYLNEKGELVFTTCFGEVKNADLYCYQNEDKKPIAAKFTKLAQPTSGQDEIWSIALGTYNKSQTLIIDPLIYSTYVGGSSDDRSVSITVDASGNAYITGATSSPDYNITTGAFQTTFAPNWDIFVTKLNATGTALIYSTYIGGAGADGGNSIAIDASSNAYITGFTGSIIDYPVTAGAFQTTNGGLTDVIVSKLNATGTALIYSTRIGGSNYEGGMSISLDATSNAYITGYTSSTNYKITAGAFQTTNAGSRDVFVTKINPTGSALIYSTYIGGNSNDEVNSISLDASGNAYITGYTSSTNYDITVGAFQTINAGSTDIFVTKLNATGTALIYSTYIGGSSGDVGNSITLDASGNAYITGYTSSTNYDITSGAFQTNNAGGTDVFVTKLNATGTALIYSTYIGGSSDDGAKSIVIDASNNAYITGNTNSTNYDITTEALQTTNVGIYDAFVSKLDVTGSTLIYSTYIGGNSSEYSNSIILDASNNAYITGWTYSTDYNITSGAFQTAFAGSTDLFVTKLCLSSEPLPALTGNTDFCNGDPLIFNGTMLQGTATNYYWEIAESDALGNPVSGGYVWNNWYSGNPSGTFTFPSLPLDCNKFYKVKLAVTNECNPWSETNLVIKINCLPTVNIDDVTLCSGDNFPVTLYSGFSKGYSFNWTNGGVTVGTATNLVVNNEGTYCVTVTRNSTGCSNTDCATVQYDPRLQYNSDFTLEVLNCNSTDPNFNVLATFPLLPTGLTFWWEVCEIDVVGNVISCMTNNSAWWNIGTTQDFDPEYTFVKGHIYKITRGIWSTPDDCVPWQASVVTNITCNATGKNSVYLSSRDKSIMQPITNSIKNTNFIIYPNPTTGNFTANVEMFVTGDLIQVLDYSGKVILEKNINTNRIELNIAEMANGLYFVKVISANGISMEKLIKN